MFEESFVSRTEVIQPLLSVGSFDKPVLGAFTVADKKKLTIPAKARERIAFVTAEVALLLRSDEIDQRPFQNVSQVVIRFNEMITRIEVTVVLQGHSQAAGGSKDTDRSRHPEPSGKSSVKIEDKHSTHILPHPFIEYLGQKTAPLGRD
jgi:hypothetical protein